MLSGTKFRETLPLIADNTDCNSSMVESSMMASNNFLVNSAILVPKISIDDYKP